MELVIAFIKEETIASVTVVIQNVLAVMVLRFEYSVNTGSRVMQLHMKNYQIGKKDCHRNTM